MDIDDFICLFTAVVSLAFTPPLPRIQTDLWIYETGESFVLICFLAAWKDRWLSFELTGGRKAGGWEEEG